MRDLHSTTVDEAARLARADAYYERPDPCEYRDEPDDPIDGELIEEDAPPHVGSESEQEWRAEMLADAEQEIAGC